MNNIGYLHLKNNRFSIAAESFELSIKLVKELSEIEVDYDVRMEMLVHRIYHLGIALKGKS